MRKISSVKSTYFSGRAAIYLAAMGVSLSQMGSASEKAVTFKKVSDVVQAWKVEQNLYVRGNLGVSQKALAELEVWLDAKAQNWTVVLLQNAKGQSWKDTRGLNYYGMDAVENALGRGLSNSVNFNAVLDEEDKREGAIFVLFLEERKFSYFADEAYDERFLGDEAWVGNLDSKAIRAMRGGSGVVNAVKDTIKLIDGKLERAKADEKARSLRAEVNKKETQVWVNRQARELGVLLQDVAKKSSELKSQTNSTNGDIVNPPINDWQQVINEAVINTDPYLAKKALLEVEREMENQRIVIQSWYRFPAEIKEIEDGLVNFEVDQSFLEGGERVGVLKQMIQLAKEAHSNAYSSHYEITGDVKQVYSDLIEKNQVLKNERLKEEELERILLENEVVAEARRKETIKTTAIAGGGIGGIALLGLGFYSNRRRRSRKHIAEQLYAEWKEAMSKRVDKLFEVMDRAAIVVGSERDLPDRGYKGKTLELSLSAIKKVDKSFVLTASVDKALGEAEELIHPNGISSRSVNVFSRSRYDDAIDLLEKKPLGSHLPVDEIKVANRGEEKMLGSRGNTENMELSFTELIAEFDQSVASAEADLDTVESAWEDVSRRTKGLGEELLNISAKDNELEKLAVDDGLFQLDALFEEWLPVAEELQIEGVDIGKSDPVKALSEKVDHGDRMVKEMHVMIQAVVDFRGSELASIEEGEKVLQEYDRDSEWVRERMHSFEHELSTLSQKGMKASVGEEMVRYQKVMFSLQNEVNQACELAKQSVVTLPKLIHEANRCSNDARIEIARDLDMTADKILVENDLWNPDLLLEDAENFRRLGQKSLDEGETSLAKKWIDKSDDLVISSNKVVTDSLAANRRYAEELEEVEGLIIRGSKLKEEGVRIMGGLINKYSRKALQIDPRDKSDGDFLEVEEALHGSYQQLIEDKNAAEQYQEKGWVLHAKHCLEDAKRSHQHVIGLNQFIQTREDELEALSMRNEQAIESNVREVVSFQQVMKDARVTHKTQAQFQELEQLCERVKVEIFDHSGESNPFTSASSLESLEDQILAIENAIENDKEAYAVANSSIIHLEQLLNESSRFVQQAEQDGIRNSHQITQSIESIHRVGNQLENTYKPQIDKDHSEWLMLYEEVQASREILSKDVLILKQELSLADSALSYLRSASRSVSDAMHWSGSYGVRISGDYGNEELQRAQRALDNGYYTEATQYATSSQRAARSAISNAESKVARIKRQKADAERKRRKVRNQARRSSISSSSSVGGSSTSSSRRSSSKSSGAKGSGFSRSGW